MIRRLLRAHWEGIVMALLMTVAFSLAGLLDEPAPLPHLRRLRQDRRGRQGMT